MYKKIMMTIFILSVFILQAISVEYFPEKPQIEYRAEYSVISNLEAYRYQPGAPMVPIKSTFMKIPVGKKIAEVSMEYRDIETIPLAKPLMPVQINQPVSLENQKSWQPPDKIIYSEQRYPEKKFLDKWHGFIGGNRIASICFYPLQYLPLQQSLEFPRKIIITYELEPAETVKDYVEGNSYASWKAMQKMGLQTSKEEPEPVYLLIVPEQFQAAYQPLLEWRQKQGITVIEGVYEDILTSYEGVDAQQKLRNYVTEQYLQNGVSHLTIGADASIVPSRVAFAFDCEYGLQDDENDLRGDMYFGCLDGSWDANGNQIYGEDDDDPDYLAEVFVARIPAETSQQVSNYVSRLIDYEQGNMADYQKAGGFSMELWSGAHSQVCQQYIYDRYFPDDYQIDFLYGWENNGVNAFDLLNTNVNFMQHTGHAWYSSLSLESGSVNQNNLYNMQNDWGGLFYSIGCWSAALDYDAIAEDMVRQLDSGFLGFIGNSRYGWGAPAAPGFGFSEFYQKEMFSLLFQENITDLAELNYAQKIPYFPYFAGTSIYKWVGYELNALGDSFCRFITQNPAEIQLTAVTLADSVRIKVTSAEEAVADATVSLGSQQAKTDSNGEVVMAHTAQVVEVYKYGYKYVQKSMEEIASEFALAVNSELEPAYEQGEQLLAETTLYNNTNEVVNFQVNYSYNEAEIELQLIGEQPNSLAANSNINLADVQIVLRPISESYQMQNGKIIPIVQQIVATGTSEILAEHTFQLQIKAPDFQIKNLQWSNYSLEPGSNNDFYFELQNIGELVAENVQINFVLEQQWLNYAEEQLTLQQPLQPGSSVVISNQLQISSDCPEEFWAVLELQFSVSEQYTFNKNISLPQAGYGYMNDFETNLNWNGDDSWQRVNTYAAEGEYSLSCRPEDIGYYAITSDFFHYLSGMELKFKYRYKMPMYGEDGFYVRLLSETNTDTLIFLGAGGALPPEDSDDCYIEAGWNQYSLNIADLTTTDWQTGDLFQIEFMFSFLELESGFNDYGNMPLIGVFLDELSLTTAGEVNNQQEEIPPAKILRVYPNPFNPMLNIKMDSEQTEIVEIYNIKGQKVAMLTKAANQKKLQWDASDMASGIYFISWQQDNKIITRKSLLLK